MKSILHSNTSWKFLKLNTLAGLIAILGHCDVIAFSLIKYAHNVRLMSLLGWVCTLLMYVCVCICVCVYVCMYVRTYVRTYVCLYIYYNLILYLESIIAKTSILLWCKVMILLTYPLIVPCIHHKGRSKGTGRVHTGS